MKCSLVKLEKFSGSEATVYTVFNEDEQKTLFDVFIEENKNSFTSEIKEVFKTLLTIGHNTGAREQFFRPNEGAYGDFCCALRHTQKGVLRLYCIRYGSEIIVISGGGPKNVRAWQDDDKLKAEMEWLKKFAGELNTRLETREIIYTKDYLEFLGELEFDI